MTTSSFVSLLLLQLAYGLSVLPKLDLSDGIQLEPHKKVTVPSINPTEVKAILEVNLVHAEPEEEVLICGLDGKCKLQGDDKEVYKPVIVSDFDVDPEEDVKGKGEEDECTIKKTTTTTTKVPVFVAYKGATPDVQPLAPEYRPQHHSWTPVYYGLKLGPEFHQPPYKNIPDHFPRGLGFRYPSPYARTIRMPLLGRRSNQGNFYWSTPNVVAVNDKVDLGVGEELPGLITPEEVKVVSKLGDLGDREQAS